MALVLCPECKASISDQAPNCPRCGFPTRAAPTNEPLTKPQDAERADPKRRRGGGISKLAMWILIAVFAIPVLLVASIYIKNTSMSPADFANSNTERLLKERMKDPDSMVIRSSYVVQRKNGPGNVVVYVCGIVSGKNGFGGYTDGTRFVSESWYIKSTDSFETDSVQLEDPEDARLAKKIGMLSGFDSMYWNAGCVDAEHPALVAHTND